MLEQGVGVVSGSLGLVEGGGERVPARFAEQAAGLFGQGGFEGAGVPLSYGFGEAAAVLAHGVHGGGGSGPVGGTQVLGGLLGCGGLLGVAAGGVPAGGGDGDEDHRGQEHRGGAAVFAFAEGVAGADDAAGGGAEGAVVGTFGPCVGSGGAFEGAGGLDEFLAG